MSVRTGPRFLAPKPLRRRLELLARWYRQAVDISSFRVIDQAGEAYETKVPLLFDRIKTVSKTYLKPL